MTERREETSVDRQALLALRTMRLRLEELEQARSEPIAIVGIGCRFPGAANDPDAFWRVLRDGVDAISEVPADRWDVDAFYDPDPDAPGKMYSRWGGFLRGLDQFDPQFFGISPREAEGLDPQQRLLLEVAWEALEHAGQSPDKLAGSPTGVFVGIGSADFSHRQSGEGQGVVDAHFGTGTAPSVAAGRLSYFLGLQGPCLAVDTACSSSLVAVHLACQSLRSRECRAALAGGVNVLLWPELTVAACKARMLAHDGRCKTFDDAADGYVRGEGCGVVVLKRLSDAVADGDTILALVRATAVNQDGRSGGLTVPNGPAQQAVIEQALNAAGIRASEVTYVEAHGTGTSLGDPIELRALGDALGGGRTMNEPLLVGSVKANIGHLEAAAGIASLIKVVLALGHAELPPHLHLRTRNRHVSWDALPIAIPDRPTPWNPSSGRRIAGVSSFGFSGTNAHAVLEQAPAPPEATATVERPVHLLALSAKTKPALVDLARAYGERLKSAAWPIQDLCYTANAGRSHFTHRLAVIGASADELERDLAAFVAAPDSAAAFYQEAQTVRASDSEVVFLFGGDRGPDQNVARSLWETQPAFRAAFERCQAALGHELDGDPALFAFEYALASLWQSFGIKPAAVLGDGVGRDVAACIDGSITLADALKIVATRPTSHASAHAGSLKTSIERLHDQGFRCFLEIGSSSFRADGQQIAGGDDVLWLTSTKSGSDGWRQLLSALRELYLRGVRIDWDGFDRGYARRKIALPTYPFQREAWWVDQPAAARSRSGFATDTEDHPLLGRRVRSSLVDGAIFSLELGPRRPPYLSDYRVRGLVTAPASLFFEAALSAAAQPDANGWCAVEDLRVSTPLVFDEDCTRAVETIVVNGAARGARIEIRSCPSERADGEAPSWSTHATGRSGAHLCTIAAFRPSGLLESARTACTCRIDPSVFDDGRRASGIDTGPAFRGIVGLWSGTHEAVGEIDLPAAAGDLFPYRIHPAMLDAAFSVATAALDVERPGNYMVVSARQLCCGRISSRRVWVHARVDGALDRLAPDVTVSLSIFDPAGTPIAWAEGVGLRRAVWTTEPRRISAAHRDLLYRIEWVPRVRDAVPGRPVALNSPDAIAAAVDAAAPEIAADGASQFVESWQSDLDALSTGYMVGALERIGARFVPGSRITIHRLMEELGVASDQLPFLRRVLRVLEEDGILVRRGDDWEVRRLPQATDAVVGAAELVRRHPAAGQPVALTARFGRHLAEILRGELDPAEFAARDDVLDLLDHVSSRSAAARVYNALLQTTIAAAVAGAPSDRPIRILELGGPSPASTEAVLAALPAARARYTLAHASPSVLRRAAAKLAAHPSIRYRRLDVNRDPVAQGFEAGSFDLLVASDVLHATVDLRTALARVRTLLAPGGLLALIESTRAHRWLDLTVGLAEGWWRFDDHDVRPAHALLKPHRWIDLLRDAGFGDVRALPNTVDDRDAVASRSLLVAVNGRMTAPPRAAAVASPARTWILFADRHGTAAALAERLRSNGDRCVLAYAADRAVPAEGDHVSLRPAEGDAIRAVVDRARSFGRPLGGIVHLWGLDADSPSTADAIEQMEARGVQTLLQTVHGLLDGGITAPIWIVTREAMAVGGDPPDDRGLLQAPLWGFGRGIGVEHPELWGGLIDVDDEPEAAASHIIEELAGSEGEDQIAFRGGERYVARLLATPHLDVSPVAWRSSASYLITGGLGALGLRLARWLVEQGARSVTIASRSALPDRAQWPTLAHGTDAYRRVRAVQEIERLGAELRVVRADVADEAEMAAMLAAFGRSAPPLRGVFHLAALLDGTALREVTPALLSAMLRPKVRGTWTLHRLTESLPLDFFVMFSSTTALLGARELSHYAAANVFLDALAHYRRARGLPALTINWGAWQGMRVDAAQARVFLHSGLEELDTRRGLSALGEVIGATLSQVAVATIDWDVLKPVYEVKRRRPLFDLIGSVDRRGSAAHRLETPSRPSILARLEHAGSVPVLEVLAECVREEVAAVLRLETARVDSRRGLFEMGLDSLMAVEFRKRLEAAVGHVLPSTLTFNYPSVEAIAGFLFTDVLGASPVDEPPPAAASSSDSVDPDEPSDLSEEELAALLAQRLAEIR